jgi:hypothetical protein
MKNKIRWLRISYWAGVIGDFAIAALALVPGSMGVPAYCYPMGLLSAIAFSWGCMLIFADRKPLERRWVLLPTILVGSMLLIAVIYSMASGAIEFGARAYNLVLYPALIALWTYSYLYTKDLEP